MASIKKTNQKNTKKETSVTKTSDESPKESDTETSTTHLSPPPKSRSVFRFMVFATAIALLLITIFVVVSPLFFPNQTQKLLQPILENFTQLTPYPKEINVLKQQQQHLQNQLQSSQQSWQRSWKNAQDNHQKTAQTLNDHLQAYNNNTAATIDPERLQTILQSHHQQNGVLLLHLNAQILQSVVYQGLPYRTHLATLTSLANLYNPPLLEQLAPLKRHQEIGVFNTSKLLASFSDLHVCTTTQPTISPVSPYNSTDDNIESTDFWNSSWLQFLEDTLANLVTISPISEKNTLLPENQDDPSNACSRWQESIIQALQINNLPLAIKQAGTPPNNASSKSLSTWLSTLTEVNRTYRSLKNLFEALPVIP